MFDQSEPESPRSRAASILTCSGILLLVAGGLLAGSLLIPFFSSRLSMASNGTSGQPALAVPTSVLPSTDSSSPSLLPLFEMDLQEHPSPVPEASSMPAPAPPPTPMPEGHTPTRIVIPIIGVDVPVVLTTWEMVSVGNVERPMWSVPAQRAAGWHEGSAPLGLPGNTVLNAHNTTYGEAFRDLYRLEAGNQILVYSDGEGFDYQVEEILFLPEAGQPIEVRLENARYIQPTQDERVTLVTCHPYASLEYRLVIIARPVALTELEAGTQED